MTKVQKAEQEDARKFLRSKLRPGSDVWTKVTHVSRSGMSRRIAFYRVGRGDVWNITGFVAKALGERLHTGDFAISVGGCGMDMCFHSVMNLSYALHGMNPKGDGARPENAGRPFKARPGHYRAGYSLNKRDL